MNKSNVDDIEVNCQMFVNKLSEDVARYKLNRRLTYRELSELTGISKDSLLNLIRLKYFPNLLTVWKLVYTLNLKYERNIIK